MTLAIPVLPNIPITVGLSMGASTVRPAVSSHIGVARRQSALASDWDGQTNDKGENGAHRLSLTKRHTLMCSLTKKGRTYRPGYPPGGGRPGWDIVWAGDSG